MIPPTMNYNQPPPPQQQYQGAAPPPTTNNAAVPTGKTPIARRTRSSKVNNNTQTTATVGPPFQYNTAPPPPTTTNNTNTAQLPSTMYNPSLSGYESLNVNDAIAKRRAELRHLQQRQRDNGTLTNVARNKLSQGGVRPTDYGVGVNNITQQQGVDSSRLQQQPPTNNNNKPPPPTQIMTNKPASNLTMPQPPQPQTNNNQTATMQLVVPTPPVARRLDNSYGVENRAPPQCQYPDQINPNNNNNLANNYNIEDNVPPMRSESYQEQRRSSSSTASSRPNLGNQKRNSEIFNAGKMKLHQQHVGSHTTQQFSSGSRENSSTLMRSGLTTEANQEQGSRSSSFTKSPFGQARTILSVKQGGNTKLGVPPFQPPLTAFNTADMSADEDNEIEVVEENEDLLQNNIMPPGKKISPTASNSNVALKLGDRLVGEVVDSGSSTPIMSNSFDEADNYHDNPTSNTQSVTAAASSSTALNTSNTTNNNSNNNMSRLMSDLHRTEREKAEALEQVNKLRLLLATNNTTTANNNEHQQPTPMATNTTSSGNTTTMPSTSSSSELLNQFREMVTRQGASAAVDWMSKQLENSGVTPDSSAALRTSPETPSRNNRPPLGTTRGASLNYAGGSELPLSSNSIPPLTPRSSSRPGSRAASPERGHGINVSSGSTTRGKRITTPLPKKLKVSNDSLDGMVTNNNGDITSQHQQQQRGQQSDNNNNSPGIEQEYLTKASKCIPNEYGTMLASYIVRRPYLTPSNSTSNTFTSTATSNKNIEEEEFLQYKQLSSKSTYTSQATVLNPNTLEVIAYIEADNSILTLSGVSNVCHGYNNNDNDWSVFDNVEENDVALGKVTYIDVDGNECDYWLDSIYEEALTTRESYCMSMISAAFALKEVTGGHQQDLVTSHQNVPLHQEYQQQPMMMQPPASPTRQQQQYQEAPPQMMMQTAPPQQQPMYQSMQQQPRYAQPPAMGDMPPLSNQQDAPPLMNEGGNVAGQPPMAAQQPPMSEKPSSEPTQQVKPKQQQEQPATASSKKKLQPEDQEYESADSALPYMIMSLFTLFLSLVTFVIKIPFRIGSTIFTFWVMIVVLRILWLLFADDGGAWTIGAGVDYEYNMPGIY